jgi:type I restriction enzyme R subunit
MPDEPVLNWGIDFANLSSYDRNLPHWRQERALYFVTFRLADSIPRSVLEVWRDERRQWLRSLNIDLNARDADLLQALRSVPADVRRSFEHEQARRLFRELDECHGACHLRNPDAANIVADAPRHYDGDRLRCGDFVVMPNHVHWLVIPISGHNLEKILHSIKRFSARRINELLGRRGKLWQKESFDRIVRDADEYERTREYVRANPERAGLNSDEFYYHRAEW